MTLSVSSFPKPIQIQTEKSYFTKDCKENAQCCSDLKRKKELKTENLNLQGCLQVPLIMLYDTGFYPSRNAPTYTPKG